MRTEFQIFIKILIFLVCLTLVVIAIMFISRSYAFAVRNNKHFRFSQYMNLSWVRFPEIKAPLLEKFHSVWPEPRPTNQLIEAIPERTIPEDILSFTMRATFDKGMSIFFPHMKFHPADLKVILTVSQLI